jgi:hypothetical protein
MYGVVSALVSRGANLLLELSLVDMTLMPGADGNYTMVRICVLCLILSSEYSRMESNNLWSVQILETLDWGDRT